MIMYILNYEIHVNTFFLDKYFCMYKLMYVHIQNIETVF